MRAVRLGSYSISATQAGMPIFERLKRLARIAHFAERAERHAALRAFRNELRNRA